MIDLKLLEKKPESGTSYYDEYKQCLLNRGADVSGLEKVLELNRKRKELMTLAENNKSKLNKFSEEIAKMKRTGQDASSLIEDMGKLSAEVKTLEANAADADEVVKQQLSTLPNKTHSSTPVGADASGNIEIKKIGNPKTFSFAVKDHVDLGDKLGVLDFERGTKVTGARFTFLKGLGARLERALIQFMMDTHSTKNGYTEMIPPFMANTQSFFGVGQFPKFKEDVFQLAGTDYYLIPTAEVPTTNYYAGEILKEEDLPISFCAYSPCFRSEAGSHGRDTRGLIRQHQFNKVELMTFCHPEKSYEQLEKLTEHAEMILSDLELPYKRMALCTGDIGFGSSKTYDLEVWLPAQKTYREISSCSNFEDFQARRANIRFKSQTGKPSFVHTLNGSGLAVGRTVVAILENYQQEDGSVQIPKALVNYMAGAKEIRLS
ncbi:MAG: serine--tRNA ligase [Pseudobdellovibrionaceae bacterium]